MLSKTRNAFGLAVLLALTTILTVLAKGQFSFIAITGPGIDEEIRSTDSGLTTDFFAFADFYRDKVNAPAEPGPGYQITRYYIDGNREIAFDQLHYYPGTGFVFYDGIVNGDSEYDDEWYSANPAIQTAFESAIAVAGVPAAKPEGVQPAKEINPGAATEPSRPVPSAVPDQAIAPFAVLVGLVVLLFIVARFRKPVTQ